LRIGNQSGAEDTLPRAVSIFKTNFRQFFGGSTGASLFGNT